MEDVFKLIEDRSKGELSWLKDNIILLVESGSHAYGTATENSDRDYKGIVIPPEEYYLGLHSFESISMSTASNEVKNDKNDIDITLYSVNKFVKLAMNASPNVLEMLFVDEESVIHSDPSGRLLLTNKNKFLSNKIKNSFGGFAGNLRRAFIKGIEKESYVHGKELVHALRIYDLAIEAMIAGRMLTKRPDADELRRIRLEKDEDISSLDEHQKGNLIDTCEEVFEIKEKEFKEAVENSVLPNKPDEEAIENLLIHLIKTYWRYGGEYNG